MKVSELVREGSQVRQAQQQHRDPFKVADALDKGAKAVYKMRGERGGFQDAGGWLGEMLSDATGLSGSFYQDKRFLEVKRKLQKIDFDIALAASEMEWVAKLLRKEHKENLKKEKARGY